MYQKALLALLEKCMKVFSETTKRRKLPITIMLYMLKRIVIVDEFEQQPTSWSR
jgi:hypothetical protein